MFRGKEYINLEQKIETFNYIYKTILRTLDEGRYIIAVLLWSYVTGRKRRVE
jgi:hypothetical protein